MKVALVPSLYSPAVGGVEGATSQLAAALQDAGDQVEVWTAWYDHGLPQTENLAGAQVTRFDYRLPPASPAAIAAAAWPALRALLANWRRMRAFAPDVINVHCFGVNGVYATALAAVGGVPLVITLHGEITGDAHRIYEKSSALRFALRWGIRRASAVVGCSARALADAHPFGLVPGAGRVIANGVAAVSPTDNETPIPITQRFVLAAGRLVSNKGFDHLLDAFGAIATERPQVSLVIAGDGPARDDLEARARSLRLEDRILFTGMLPSGTLRSMMARACVVAAPSLVEAFGLVVLESLHAGTPVIVNRATGAADVVRVGVDGWIVDVTDRSAFSDALEHAIDTGRDEDLRRNRKAYAESYTWQAAAEQYRTLYASVAKA